MSETLTKTGYNYFMVNTKLLNLSVGTRATFIKDVVVEVVVVNDIPDDNDDILVATDDGFTFRAWAFDLWTNPQAVAFQLR